MSLCLKQEQNLPVGSENKIILGWIILFLTPLADIFSFKHKFDQIKNHIFFRKQNFISSVIMFGNVFWFKIV